MRFPSLVQNEFLREFTTSYSSIAPTETTSVVSNLRTRFWNVMIRTSCLHLSN